MALTYTGNGRWIAGIPAQDLDDTQLAILADQHDKTVTQIIEMCVSSGAYHEVAQTPVAAKPTRRVKKADKTETTDAGIILDVEDDEDSEQ